MNKFTINKDEQFTEFDTIELELDLTKDKQAIVFKDQDFELYHISTIRFLLSRYLLATIIFIIVILMFLYNYTLIGIFYIILSIVGYYVIKKICLVKHLNKIMAISYLIHASVYFLSVFMFKSNSEIASWLILGAFTFHLVLFVMFLLDRYATVFEIVEKTPSGDWYLWKNNFNCKDTE